MKSKKHMKNILFGTLVGSIFLGSCSIGVEPDTMGPEEDLQRLDQEILGLTARSAAAAAEGQLNASGSVDANTTYNFENGSVSVDVPSGDEANLPDRSDYPYPGWTTGGTIRHIADPGTFGENNEWTQEIADQYSGDLELFQVTTIATPNQDYQDVYPENSVREMYYIVSSDLTVDLTDQATIFDPFGHNGTAYRDEYVAEYGDGSTRRHWILGTDTDVSIDKMAKFDIDGSMEFANVYDETLAAGGDEQAKYSSLTLYTHELGKTYNYWFWNEDDGVEPTITGMRYYTEHVDGDQYVATSVTFEYTTNTASEPTLRLARTTIREEMRFELTQDDTGNYGAGAARDHTLRSRTEITNSSGGDDLLYTSNGKQISRWANRGNAQEKQVERLVGELLPADYSEVATQFEVDLTWAD